MHISRNSGVTLAEMMIAMVLLTIISGICYSTLNTAFSLQTRDNEYQETIRQAQIVFAQIEKDLRCAFQNKFVSVSKTTKKFYRSFEGHTNKVHFLRVGNHGVAEVSYILKQGTDYLQLLRRYNPVAHEEISHGEEGDGELRAVVLENVYHFQLRYLGYDGEYYDVWPVPNRLVPSLPRAVEITIVISISETKFTLPVQLVEIMLGGN